MVKTIVIGSDHGGYALKKAIKSVLEKTSYNIIDVGAHSEKPCDYPELGFEAARQVALKKAWRGIVICKSGIGMAMIANKLPGARAGLCLSVEDAASARKHNDANILVLAAKKTRPEKALSIVETWLETGALKGRHARRVRQIRAFENKVFKKII
ncbi:MAG: RpiB/LacA/LacB family sugar-phosphate isomerase [Candidatus Omnitrophica bacterium]|nr:RpiB/LacA/LacB family sugar-phosphate isomerase [Candidatus Omnitrophota bacterium]MBU1128950.1 RpiB/LacA/LacB family sugar-phosphate isomerase [Candidatus Omnitrophota bacterium]MBU1657151.1 RpiB/LacA/LacB family sugar-phosphate isomerase [Candidatus Omnitrophota bacterium]MBU1784105.1 RpiB/LacA/LacB family sugar-phosphate isomerase [Candidatus Omnitrophota bacterium]MBU1850835.1 RpiB/LacA/LacB family sugar-phosphate isomerase [Candidatus Omnitrophota bacterium]